MVEDSTNDPTQLSSSVFHEDNIRVAAINTVEENIFHLSSLFFHDSSIYSASVWRVISWMFWKKDHILEMLHSLSLDSCFICIPIWLLAPIFRVSQKMRTPTFTWSWSHLMWFESKVSRVSTWIWISSHPGWFSMQVQMASRFTCFHCWRIQEHVLGAWSTSSQEEDSSRHSHSVWSVYIFWFLFHVHFWGRIFPMWFFLFP